MRPGGIFDESYDTEQAIVRTRWQWVLLLGALVVLFTFPLYGSPHFIWTWLNPDLLNMIGIYVIVVLGLQIVSGICGQISLGHCGVFAVGAYVSAIMVTEAGLSFWIALPCAGLAAGVVGMIIGAPSLRIKGFYLALATLAGYYIIWWLAQHLPITRGVTGGLPAAPPTIFGFPLDTDERMFYLIMILMVVMTFFAKNLLRTQTGRAFIAIRDNDIAAEAMGVNVFRYKLLAFFIACFYAGIGGALLAHLWTVVTPEMFPLWYNIWFIAMIIVGGMGNITGVFLGVTFLQLLDVLIVEASPKLAAAIPALGAVSGAALGWIVFGIILVLFLLFEPRGLAHRWELFKAAYRLYPFPY